MIVDPKSQGYKDLMDIVIIARNMDIGHLNIDQSLCGQQINQQKRMKVTIIRIITPGTIVTIVIKRDVLLMFVGVDESIRQTHLKTKVTVTSATCKDI